MMDIRLHLKYCAFTLDVDLQLPGRGVSALYGHSGSGKTTCLRCIAGLERAEHGFVQINDDVEACYGEVMAILRAERLKRRRQIGLIGFARDLIRSVPDADKNL